MDGKPVIDILVVVQSLSLADKYAIQLEAFGYEFLPKYIKPDAHLFRKTENGFSTFNVHIFEQRHPHVKEMLIIRDGN